MIWIRISDPRSLGSWCIKGTDESVTRVDSSVPLMHHDPSDLGSLTLIQITPKERTLRFVLMLRGHAKSRIRFEHREHTILLSRKRVNKGMKGMNRLTLSPVVVSYATPLPTCSIYVLRNTVARNSYLGLFALRKKILVYIYY